MDKFKELNKTEYDALSQAEQATYLDNKKAHEKAELESKFKALENKLEALGTSSETVEMKKQLSDAMEEIKALKAEQVSEKFKMLENAIENVSKQISNSESQDIDKDGITLDKIKAVAEKLKEDKQGRHEIGVLKAVGSMTQADNLTGRVVVPMRVPGVNMVPRNNFVMRAAASVGRTMSNLVTWVEQQGIEGSAAMTGEGLAKSQVDFNLVEANAQVKKITAYTKVSTEMLEDVDQIQSTIQNQLLHEIDKVEETQLLTGVGTTIYLNGITKYAQTLDLVAVEDSFGLNKSNRWDAISAAITQIEENLGGQANAIFMRASDVFIMTNGAKTTTGEYVYPVTVTPDGTFIYGVRVIKTNSIPAGYFLVADMTKFYINDRTPVMVEMGYENDDFTKNFVTIRAEKRLESHIMANDVEGFVYDTFANAKTFLESAT